MSTTPPNPARIMEIGFGFWASRALLTAVEMGLFSELGSGPLDYEALRQRLGLHTRSARDFFDALVAIGMLERDGTTYRNGADADMFLDRAKPDYIGGIMEMCSARLYGFWNGLGDGLRTGRPQNEAKTGSGDLFDVLYQDPARLRGFLEGMTGVSRVTARAIAAKFPWSKYKTMIDIGCAQGCTPVEVAAVHPHISGGGFDLPVVQPIYEEYVAKHGLSQRLRFHPGSFFDDPLPTADVLVMGHILHDWNLETKKMLLRKAYDALPSGGALIVYEAIIDDDRRQNAFGLLMSLNMLIETDGGFDFTGADCSGWMREVGFRDTRVEPLDGPDSMVIGTK